MQNNDEQNTGLVIAGFGRRVLLVEDDPLVSNHLDALLAAAGYAVTVAESIEAACDEVAHTFYPIAILDRGLADGDGLILCEHLRAGARPSRVFVLVLSSRDSAHEKGEGLRAGADVYLSKRTTEAELLAYLNAASLVEQFVARLAR